MPRMVRGGVHQPTVKPRPHRLRYREQPRCKRRDLQGIVLMEIIGVSRTILRPARGAPRSPRIRSLKEDALLGQSFLRAGWHPSFETGASRIHPPSRCSAPPSRRCAQGVAAIREPRQWPHENSTHGVLWGNGRETHPRTCDAALSRTSWPHGAWRHRETRGGAWRATGPILPRRSGSRPDPLCGASRISMCAWTTVPRIQPGNGRYGTRPSPGHRT